MSAAYKSLLLAGLLSFAPSLTFTATAPDATEPTAEEPAPLLTLDLNQVKDLAVPYLAALLPITKDTLTFVHTNADALCKELLFNLDHQQETLAARKKATIDLVLSFEALCKHLIMLPAPDLQTALKNPKTQALLKAMANRWNAIETTTTSLYPTANCPLMNQAVQTGLAALRKLAADLWIMAKTNGAQLFTKPLKQLTTQEKAQATAAVHGLCASFAQLTARTFDASIQCKELSKKLVEALGVALKDNALYNDFVAKIDQSQRATAEEKFFDAIAGLVLNEEAASNSAALEQLRQAYLAQDQAVIAFTLPEQQRFSMSVAKLQQVILQLFFMNRATK